MNCKLQLQINLFRNTTCFPLSSSPPLSISHTMWEFNTLLYCFVLFTRIVYREVKEEDGSGPEVGGESTPVITLYSRGSRDAGTLSSTTSPSTPIPGTPSMSCTVEDVLQLLRHLFVISTFRDDAQNQAEGKKYIEFKWEFHFHGHVLTIVIITNID